MALHPRKERDLFLEALRFASRLPIPARDPGRPRPALNAAARYFPLTGLLLGLIAAAIYELGLFLFPPSLSLLLAMVAAIWLGRGLPEYGFARTSEALARGRDRDQIVAVMQEPWLGINGALALGLLLAVKFLALEGLDAGGLVAPALIVSHTWSRALAISYLAEMDYLPGRHAPFEDATPAPTRMSSYGHRFALLTALPVAVLLPWMQVLAVVVALLLLRAWFAYLMRKRLGGYTGVSLGAAQQVAEVVIYLVILALTVT